MTKIELDQLFASNPKQAFELIYNQYYNMLCNYAMRITYDRNSAEDVVQEVILELWNRKDKLSPDAAVIPYLKRSVYNRSLNLVRSKAMNFDSDEGLIYESDNTPGADQELIGSELKTKISNIVASLPERCRIVFALSRYEEKSYKEIAEELNISVKTVENQISKALKILKKKLI